MDVSDGERDKNLLNANARKSFTSRNDNAGAVGEKKEK